MPALSSEKGADDRAEYAFVRQSRGLSHLLLPYLKHALEALAAVQREKNFRSSPAVHKNELNKVPLEQESSASIIR